MSASATQTADWGDHSHWTWLGFRCHWRVLGPNHGPTLVLLHGFGASSAHWRRLAPILALRGYRVFALDLIGFGASDQPPWNRRYPLDNRLWGRQTVAFLREVVGGPAVLVGNSLGGLTALTAAVLCPELVLALVAAPLPDPALVQPWPKRRSPLQRGLLRRLIPLVMRLLPLELLIPLISRTPLLQRGLQGAYHRPVQDDHELLRLIAKPARRRTAAQALRAMSIGMALRPRGATAPELLQQLAGRRSLLLIWGRDDRFVPLSIGADLAQNNPWISLEVIHQSGHCPHDETPEAFVSTIVPWLDRNLGGSSPAETGQRR